MAITKTYVKSNYCEIMGLSTDTKPNDPIEVSNGSIFVEMDTGKVFFYDEDGEEWIEQFSFQG